MLYGFSVHAINVATGRSHSNNVPDGNDPLFWWDASNNQPTQILINAVADIQTELAPSQDLDGLIWAQGESDAVSIYYSSAGITETIRSEFAAATVNIFQYLRNAFCADLPIYVQQLNDFDIPNGATFPQRGEQDIIIADQRDTHLGAVTLGATQRDPSHFDTVAQNNIAEQLADKVVEIDSAP
ncbi:sialate O-acetylesterase [Litorimonas sp. WD9-15]|uniref:sialate O-acetylesterase n=1 Tax=Litorimonas sp. WD9-15 TaxID=3418716 RepID=UPI003CFE07CB